jgi:hypothetical protein
MRSPFFAILSPPPLGQAKIDAGQVVQSHTLDDTTLVRGGNVIKGRFVQLP